MTYSPNSLQDKLDQHIKDNQKDMGELKDDIRELKRLLIGNEVTGEKGLIIKIDTLFTLFTEGNAIRRAVIWVFSGIVATSAFVYTIIKIFKEIK